MGFMFYNTTLSVQNYDDLLEGCRGYLYNQGLPLMVAILGIVIILQDNI
jgi:hypothetical protein